MLYQSSRYAKEALSALIFLAAFCLLSTVTMFAQTSVDVSQPSGANDPLVFDLTSNRHRNTNIFPAKSILAKARASISPAAGELDPSFSPAVDSSPGLARASVVQPDGKTLVGGYFRTLNGVRHDSLVRLNVDGSIDATFAASIIGTVNAIASQADGKIVIGGSFTAVNGERRIRIARLNSDGSLDQSFAVGTGADNAVYDIVIQSDGKILLGGLFTSVNSVVRNVIARLNTDGSVDAGFTSPLPLPPPPFPFQQFDPPSAVFCLALQSDGRVLIGGFLVVNYEGHVVYNILRLNENGTIDSSLDVRLNSDVYKIIVQPDGKLVIGGFFTTVGTTSRRYIARLNSNGSVDTSFDAGSEAAAPVQTLYFKPDGKILFGSRIVAASPALVKQLNPTGSLDISFVPSETMTGSVYLISPTAAGGFLVAGSFYSVFDNDPNTALRFNSDGTPDQSFSLNSTALGGVRAIVTQSDGKIILGGNFNRVNGLSKKGLARLNADGTLDDAFNTPSGFQSSLGARVNALLVQPDGKVLVAGTGLSAESSSGYEIVRLNADGMADASFTPVNINVPAVKAIGLQPDGKILYSPGTPGISNRPMSRLNSDGTPDTSFTCDLNITIEAIVALPNGKVLVAGPFSFGYVSSGSGSEFHNGVLRLNANGSHDRTFISGLYSNGLAGAFSSVYALERLPDGRILAGGTIYASAMSPPAGITRLNESGTIDDTFQRGAISSPYEEPRVEDLEILSDGKVMAAGLFNSYGGTQRGNIVRLQADGSVDSSFSASSDHTIYKLAVQNDQRVLIGGDFNTVNGTAQSAIARLLSGSSTGSTLFDYDADGRADLSVRRPADNTWYLLRGTAGYMLMTFGVDGDLMVPADYDGDGKTDIAMFRPSNGTWYIFNSQSQSFTTVGWGASGDMPVPADHDGDGKADLVLFRPSTNTWYTRFANGTFSTTVFGVAGDKPVVGDFDGDGKYDIGLYRPSDNNWYILKTGFGFFVQTWGQAGDIPVPADYDGDGKTDVAVFRPSTGQWFRIQSTAGFDTVNWGVNGDKPIPADYDGDGKSDVAVFRNSDAIWYIVGSTAGQLIQNYGVAGDLPTQGAFIY